MNINNIQPVIVGKLRFEFAEVTEKKRGAVTVQRIKYQCPLCKQKLLKQSIHQHLELHDRRQEKKRITKALRDLGATAKPRPGQLALDGIDGVSDLMPEHLRDHGEYDDH